MFFLEWSIFTKLAIIIGYILIAPLICWADAEDYGISGAYVYANEADILNIELVGIFFVT